MADERDTISVNGNKMIDFISAVEDMSSILGQLQLSDIADAFLEGKQFGAVERVIEQKKTWENALREIHKTMRDDLHLFEKSLEKERELKTFLHSLVNFCRSPEAKQTFEGLEKLADILDRLEKHRNSGLMETMLKSVK